MFSPRNVALVLVRFLGVVALLFGVLWLVNIVGVVALFIGHAPEWLTSAVWGYTAPGLLSGPIWFVTGLVVLKLSRPLAAFVAKGADRVD